MHKCQIQWIDSRGETTPDNNNAIAKVRTTHKELAKLTGLHHEPSEEFFICSEHLERMMNPIRILEFKDWEVTEILVTNQNIRAILRD